LVCSFCLQGECGFLVLLAAFDCIDDIKLVKQVVLSEILASLPEVITNRNGKKVLPHPPITRNHPGAGERRWKRPQVSPATTYQSLHTN
jgi:hypothetical protein